MMRKINVYEILSVNTNNSSVQTEEMGTVILPIGIGELLDERLDEATITVFNDKTEKYKPLTEIRIRIEEVEEGEIYGEVFNYYFLVARDNATRVFPQPGITRTKHELYLVERTKLLEGIVCPSLTFTNTLKDEVSSPDKPMFEAFGFREIVGDPDFGGNNDYYYVTENIPDDELPAFQQRFMQLPERILKDYIFPSPFEVANGAPITYFFRFKTTDPNEISQYDKYWFNSITIRERRSQALVGKKVYNTVSTEASEEEQFDAITEPFALSQPLSNGFYIVEYYIVTVDTPDTTPRYVGLTFNYVVEVVDGLWASKLTITDVIKRTLFCAEPIATDAASNSYPALYAPKFRLNSAQEDQYRQIPAPEFTLSEGTLREQLRTIGGYIHGEPYLDENNIVYFLDLGLEEEAEINGKDALLTSNWDVNNYCTGIRTFGDNLTASFGFAGGATVEPPGLFTKSLRSEKMYAMINEEACVVEASYPIYRIEKLLCGVRLNSEVDTWYIKPVDITKYIYEETIYNSLSGYEETISGNPLETKSRAIYYTRNSKYIKGLTYLNPQDDGTSSAVFSRFAIANILGMATSYDPETIHDLLIRFINRLEFRIEYIPLLPALLEHGKNYIEPLSYSSRGENKFSQVYNQSDSVIEAASFGENIKGVAARLGNHEIEQTFLFRSVKDIPKVGQLYNGYAISATYSEIMPKNVKCTVALTKDFNRISQYIGVPSHKRLFEISETNVTDRRILIHNTLRISNKLFTGSCKRTGAPLVYTENALFSIMKLLTRHYNSGEEYPDIGKINCVYAHTLDTENDITKILLPANPIALGNSITASFSYMDNYSAGNQAAKSTLGAQYFQRDVRYPDKYGRLNDLVFHLIDTPERLSSSINKAQLSKTLPQIKGDITTAGEMLPADLGFAKYRVQKDNRERLFIASQLESKSEIEGLFVGSGLMKLSSMHYAQNIDPTEFRLYLIFDKKELPRRFDTQYYRMQSDDQNANKYKVYNVAGTDGSSGIEEVSVFRFDCNYATFGDNSYVTLEGADFVPSRYTNGAVGWVLARKPIISTRRVMGLDGVPFDQITEEGGEILLYKVGHIAPNKRIVPKMYFYITNE